MPGRRPRKVDCAGGSTASDVSAVAVSLLDHLGGVEQTVGDPGVGGALALPAPRSWLGGLTRGQRAAEFSGAVQGFFRAKAPRFSANDDDACGCRIPLEGVVVVILSALRLRVKTLDLTVSTAAALCVVTLLGASSWSPVATQYCFVVFVVLVFPCFSLSLSLICFVRGSPLHLVSVRPLVAI
jgi:hypothetical protein